MPGSSALACGGGHSVPGGAAGGRAAPCTLAVPSPPASGAAPAAAHRRHIMRPSCSHGQDRTEDSCAGIMLWLGGSMLASSAPSRPGCRRAERERMLVSALSF